MKKIFFVFIMLFLLFKGTEAMAGSAGSTDSGSDTGSAASVKITNPLGSIDSPQKLIGQIINAVLGIIGSLALVMFIYGGFTWMMASGNQTKVTKGKDILLWATVGLIIIFSSYALVKFVLTNIGALKT